MHTGISGQSMAAVALVILPCGPLSAEQVEDYLSEIIVTARQPVVSEVATAHTVDLEEIELRGDRSLDDVMELIPGANVRTGNQAVPRLDIRGLRTRHIKLLVNGVLFNSSFDGQFDPTLLPTEQMERVKVTTGGISELYGSGALAVINIITRSESDSPLTALTDIGENGDMRLAATAGGSDGPVSYFFSASHRDRDGFEVADDFAPTSLEDGGLRLNSDRRRSNAFGNFVYEPDARLRLGLTASAVSGEYGLPPTTVDDPSGTFVGRPTFERVEDQAAYTVQGSFDYNADRDWFARGWVYGNWLEQDENRYDDATFSSIDDVAQNGNFLTEVDTEIGGFGLQAGRQFNLRSRITVAVDVHRDSWEQDGVIRDVEVSGGGSSTFDLRSLENDFVLWNGSVSAEIEYEPIDRLGLVVGGSTHWIDGDLSVSDSESTFLAAATYALTDAAGAKFSWSRKARAPSIRQLYDETRGNAELDYEVVDAYEGGVTWDSDANWAAGVSIFRMDVEDFIERNDATDLFENIDDSLLQGVEVSGTSYIADRLRLRASYSYLDSEDQTDSGRDELQNRPRHIVIADADLEIGQGFAAHMKVRHVADQIFYSRRPPFIKAGLDDFTVVDARLRWQAWSGLQFHLGADNLFDENYEEEFGLPNPGRFLYGGLKWSL